MKKLVFISTFTAGLTLSTAILPMAGCHNSTSLESSADALAALSNRFNSKLESRLTETERNLILSDLTVLSGLNLGSKPDPWIAAIFGTGPRPDFIEYLDDRIGYVFPSSVDPQILRSPGGETTREEIPSTSGHYIVATNLSPALWFEQIKTPSQVLSFEFNGRGIPIRSSRVGVIRLGAHFSDATRSALVRVGTLIHEARHSDCTGGLSVADVARIRRHQFPENLRCGYAHSICPAQYHLPDGTMQPHPFAGLRACDSVAWGPYSIQAVFLRELYNNCTNCSEIQKQEALMAATDDFLRVGDLVAPMLKGDLGQPDMASE